jgi:phosphatidylglycerophosphate synthase
VCFACLAFDYYLLALLTFAIAAGTDWVDGFWARRYGQITQLGRILDPFADKIVICGTFIFLAAVPAAISGAGRQPASEIAPWMAVVVVGRELLVTALRSIAARPNGPANGRWSFNAWPPLPACGGCGRMASKGESHPIGSRRRPSGRPGHCGCWSGSPS